VNIKAAIEEYNGQGLLVTIWKLCFWLPAKWTLQLWYHHLLFKSINLISLL